MSDRAEKEAVAVALGAMKCSACGGMLVPGPVRAKRGETVHVVSIDQKMYRCPGCEAKYAARPEHEAGCFCAECLR